MSSPIEDLNELADAAAKRHSGLMESKETVRTTFKISEDAVDILRSLADKTGSSQKEKLDEVLKMSRDILEENEQQFTDTIRSISIENPERKAMAINSDTRDGLNELSERFDVPRDNLVEAGLRLAQAVVETRREKAEELFEEEILPYCKRGEEIEKLLLEELGKDHPLTKAFGRPVGSLLQTVSDVKEDLRHDSPIAPDSL